MRILVLAPQPFMVQRGTPIAVKMLLEALSARGDEIDALVFTGGEPVEIARTRFFHVPALSSMPPGFSVKKILADMLMVPMTGWRMLRGRYDLVIAVEESAYIAMVLGVFFRIPYLCDVDSSIPEQIDDKFSPPRWLQRFLVSSERLSLRRSSGAMTCCRALEDLVRHHAPDLPVQTLEDVPMLEPDTGGPVPEDCRFDVPVMMYVGNLESYQGIDLLLDGFARVDPVATPAQLVIIGGTRVHIDSYRTRADDLGLADRVSFLGPKPVADLGRYLRAAAITCSPRTQGRNTPMKIYSYLDSGQPLLATRLLTHTQVLDDEIAMLVDPEPDDVARGMTALLVDPDLGARLAAAARTRVAAEFSPEAYTRKLNRFLAEEIEPRLPRRSALAV
ncbi:MAG: glycosyltransferase family 4 protein [Rhodobacteraceae bacterium]|nr:glycosyltransferase family 4 protein [Paracoccaceae bacterium]